MKSVFYNLPTDRNIGTQGKETLDFFNAFSALVESFLEETTSYDRSSGNSVDLRLNSGSSKWVHRPMNDEMAYKLQELRNAYLNSISEVYKKGVNDGKNLLFMLQSGKITVNEINKHDPKKHTRRLPWWWPPTKTRKRKKSKDGAVSPVAPGRSNIEQAKK